VSECLEGQSLFDNQAYVGDIHLDCCICTLLIGYLKPRSSSSREIDHFRSYVGRYVTTLLIRTLKCTRARRFSLRQSTCGLQTHILLSQYLAEPHPIPKMRHRSGGTPGVKSYRLASNVFKRHSYRPGCHHSSSARSLSSLTHAAPYPAPSDYILSHPQTLFSKCQG
jgi:hypothetical protein